MLLNFLSFYRGISTQKSSESVALGALAGMIGVEPILQESKSRVLPLHHIPMHPIIISQKIGFVNTKRRKNII